MTALAWLIVVALWGHLVRILIVVLLVAMWAGLAFAAGAVLGIVVKGILGVARAWRERAGVRVGVSARRRTGAVSTPADPTPPGEGQGQLIVMGPVDAVFRDRVDPYTRTRFQMGERFVRCGGQCSRLYKLATCEVLGHRCPVDGTSLRPRRMTR